MQPIQNARLWSTDARELRRTLRVKQADRFEMMAAASEAEDLCPIWIAERLIESERVSS